MEKNKERKPDGYWQDYDNCYNAAKECTTKKEFTKKYSRACNVAREHGWFKDYTWFVEVRKPKGYYTYEKCYEIAKECCTIKDYLKKCSRAYQVSLKNGWISDYTWFERVAKPNGYWKNYENCFNAAKQCITRSELLDKYYQAYYWANKNGWISDYTWFNEPLNVMTDNVDTVYAYLFENIKVAYVGRTINMNARDLEHRGIYHGDRNDAVLEFCKKNGIEAPVPVILKEKLTIKDGLYYEDFYKNYYKQLGYTLLNKAKTGIGSGSIGGIGKYTKQHCYETAMKCTTHNEFFRKFNGEWQKANKKGWLKEYTWLSYMKKPNGYWKNYENCYNAAKECETSAEFNDKYPIAFAYSRKMGWHLDFVWLKGTRAIRGTKTNNQLDH